MQRRRFIVLAALCLALVSISIAGAQQTTTIGNLPTLASPLPGYYTVVDDGSAHTWKATLSSVVGAVITPGPTPYPTPTVNATATACGAAVSASVRTVLVPVCPTSAPGVTPTPATYAAMIETDQPNFLWTGTQSSGNAVDTQQGKILAPQGTPSPGAATLLSTGELAVAFPSTGNCYRSNTATGGWIGNPHVLTIMTMLRVPSPAPTATAYIFQSNDTSNNHGFQIWYSAGGSAAAHLGFTINGVVASDTGLTTTPGANTFFGVTFDGNVYYAVEATTTTPNVGTATRVGPIQGITSDDTAANMELGGGNSSCSNGGEGVVIGMTALWYDRMIPVTRLEQYASAAFNGVYTNPF